MDDLKTLMFRARLLNKQDNWGKEAIRVNTRIIESKPSHVAAYNRRARCYWYAGDLSAAREDYARARALRPDNDLIRQAIRDLDEEIARQRADDAYAEKMKRVGSFRTAYRLGTSL